MSIAEVDFAYEEDDSDPLAFLASLQKKYTTLRVMVIDVDGPGGGWPIVRFTGDRDDVETVLRVHWGMEDEDINDTITKVEGA